MRGMTTQDRLDDICEISGLSEEIVRRVLESERESIIKSLKRGERATLIGRCAIKPELRNKLMVGGEFRKCIKLKASIAASLEERLSDLDGFEGDCEEEDDGIMVSQIAALV